MYTPKISILSKIDGAMERSLPSLTIDYTKTILRSNTHTEPQGATTEKGGQLEGGDATVCELRCVTVSYGVARCVRCQS